MNNKTKFSELKKVIKHLRGQKGCPWDRKQTHKSLMPYFYSEVKEFENELYKKNYEKMKEELGDVLLQVMLHSQIANENKKFDIEDVVSILIKKLKRRHPHVFGNTRIDSVEDVVVNWNKIKLREKALQ